MYNKNRLINQINLSLARFFQIPLCVVKPLDKSLEISLNGSIQYTNGALAVALSSYWMNKKESICLYPIFLVVLN